MPADTAAILTAARAAAARYRASATGSAYRADHEAIAAALAEVDRLSARVAELERERAGDVAGIVGWLRAKVGAAYGSGHVPGTAGWTYREIADAIERGDWREGVERG